MYAEGMLSGALHAITTLLPTKASMVSGLSGGSSKSPRRAIRSLAGREAINLFLEPATHLENDFFNNNR